MASEGSSEDFTDHGRSINDREDEGKKPLDDPPPQKFERRWSTRKILRMPCEIHTDKELVEYCLNHKVPVCKKCADTETHFSCEFKDIKKEIADRKSDLTTLLINGKTKYYELKKCEAAIDVGVQDVDTHLKKIEDKLRIIANKELQNIADEEKLAKDQINKEADEEIAKINEVREDNLGHIVENFRQRINNIEVEKALLMEDLKSVKDTLKQKFNDMKAQYQNTLATLDEYLGSAKKLATDDKGVMKDFHNVVEVLSTAMKSKARTDEPERVKNLTSIAQKVSFWEVEDRIMGRIGVPTGKSPKENKWPTELSEPTHMIGSVKHDEVLLRDKFGLVYIKNLDQKPPYLLSEGKKMSDIWTAACLEDGRIVCGTTNSEIVVYEQTWKHIGTILLPSEEGDYKTVHVSVDKNNLIVAALYKSSQIYAYNPDTLRLMRSFTLEKSPVYELQCLSSGNIILLTTCSSSEDNVCVRLVNAFGETKSTTHFHDKYVKRISVDRLTDLVQVMYYDSQHDRYAVDVLSPSGTLKSERDLKFPRNEKLVSYFPSCAFLKSGKLAICIDGKINVYKEKIQDVGDYIKEVI